MKKKTVMDAIKFITVVVAGGAIVVGAIYSIDRYFAKQSVTEKQGKRIDFNFSNDLVQQQEQNLLRVEMEMRQQPMTKRERMEYKKQKERLAELKAQRIEAEKSYRSAE